MELQLTYAVLCGVATLVVGCVLWIYRWMNPRCNGRLPPGSMGLPIVGESFQFFRMSPSLDISDFYKLRLKWYGPLFKTSLLGRPVIVSMDMDVNRFIFQQEGKLFRIWYPDTANRILGEKSFAAYDGSIHKHVRSFAAQLFGPHNLREVLIGEMEGAVVESLQTWANQPSVDVHDAVANMTFNLITKKLIGFDAMKSRELSKNFEEFFRGLIAFPIYVPGTRFYRCMQGRKKVQKVLKDLVKKRLGSSGTQHDDFLDVVVKELQSKSTSIDENFMIDLITALMFASFSSISTMLTIAMKFLTDNPNVVKALTEEHEAILKQREDISSALTWEEYKSMKFTAMVTNELTRVSSIAPGIFRKALKDAHVNGYTIPAGWMVIISPMSVHLNPELFKDPLTFNPWRWQGSGGCSLQKNLIPFGDGVRLCIGAEFSKLQITLFLHILVTKYRWKEVKGGGVFRMPEIVLPRAYHIQLFPRTC